MADATLTVIPPPKGLAIVSIDGSTAHVTWQAVNKVVIYQVSITNSNNPSVSVLKNTTLTFMDLSNLKPCSTYIIGVSSVNSFLDAGEPANVSYSTSTMDTVPFTSADYSCSSAMVTVTWGEVPGATSYSAAVIDSNGMSLFCNSTSDTCNVPITTCGERYLVQVTAISADCQSTSNLPTYFDTVPCAPTQPSLYRECSSNVIIFSWLPSNNTYYYMAQSQDSGGRVVECITTDTTCFFTDTDCGLSYQFTVSAVSDCNSDFSSPKHIRTAPCLPQNIMTSVDCASDSLITSWDLATGALSYTVEASGTQGGIYNCSSVNNSCAIPGVGCGDSLSIWITASDHDCTTQEALGQAAETTPCPPNQIMAYRDCKTNEVLVMWQNNEVNGFYVASLQDQNGGQLSCNTSSASSCIVRQLHCGKTYTVTVTYSDGVCPSTSAPITMDAVPCIPTNITAVHTCGQTSIDVTWATSLGATHYTAVATGNSGYQSECSSNQTSCSITNLHCGQVYTVGVMVTNDNNCTTILSQTISLLSDPCPPTNLSSIMDCSSDSTFLSWSPSPNAVSYSGMAVGLNGAVLSCNTSTNSCVLGRMACAQVYNLTVSASDGTCVTPYSAPFVQHSAPCTPVNVNTHLNCESNILMVSWDAGPKPLNYSATASAGDGTAVSCNVQNTICSLTGLHCGQQYNVTVMASYGSCSGPNSTPQYIQTAPCIPLNVRGDMTCGTHNVMASWSSAPGANSYVAMVMGPNGYSGSCNTTNLSCPFSGLSCASQYDISVMSQGSSCNSSVNQTSMITAPCDPLNVAYALECGTDLVNISWDASSGAVAYSVFAQVDESLHVTSCTSNTTSCQLNVFGCGQMYNVSVLADNGICNSIGEKSSILITAPCPPTILHSSLNCGRDSATLSWTSVPNAIGYMANATSTNGQLAWCSSANNTSCELTGLHCGEVYSVTVITKGNQCASTPSSSVNITTAPCAPTMVTSQYNCSSNIAVLNWADSVGRISFIAQLDGRDHQNNCTSTSTSCSFTGLYCGHSYNITVQALGTECNSHLSTPVEVDTVPCAPQNVSASLVCANHSALITWVGNPRTVSYNVIALGQDGDSQNCQTNGTSCQISNMHCGTIYVITVTPSSRTCSGVTSTAYTFNAGSCPPTNVIVSPQCNSNMSSIFWTVVARADMYVATATDNNGHIDTCSSNSTGCSFIALQCAQTYNVTVVTIDRGCASDLTSNAELRTALCPPSNLKGSVSCQTNILSLTWDASPVNNAKYTLFSEQIRGANTTTFYPTSDNFLSISGLQCGELYKLQVVASDSTCNSSLSLPLMTNTVPCQPTNLEVNVECGTNRGIISWVKSIGANYFIAAVLGNDGHVASCTSNDTSCAVTLHCGEQYSATLVASTDICNSTQHTDITFYSAPCLPQNVVAELDCQSNHLTVQWLDPSGEDNYTALAIRSDGYQDSCYSSSNSCSITNLQCGQTYQIAVTSSAINCSVIVGSDYQIQSVPCNPQNSTVAMEISTNVATVTWDLTSTSQNYTVTATDMFGVNSSCSTNRTSCSFSELSCGQTYTFTIMGHTNMCMSEVSSPMQMPTAPCRPTNVSSSLDCGTGVVLITWNNAAGITAYTVQANGNHGHNSSCNSTETQCSLSNLECGQEYTVVVVPMQTGYPGQASQAVNVTTAPCSPQPVETQLNCLSGALTITWPPRAGATNYHAIVQDASNVMTCDTNTTSCVVPNLSCSNTYNVTVVAHGQSCNSSHCDVKEILTAPCSPTGVSATVNCSTNFAEVTWNSQNAPGVAYSAQALSAQGSSVYCNTTDSSCTVIGLKCGSVYNVTVIASKDNCSSLPSLAYTFITVPCVPFLSDVQLLCSSNSASVTWATAAGAERYEVTAEDSLGGTQQCNATDVTSCPVSGLQCGQLYGFSVTASDRLCTSAPSAVIQSFAAPCLPQNVHTSVGCENRTASISWSNSQGALSYTARLDGAGGEAYCFSNTSSCDMPLLPCGEMYNVTVTANGHTCNSSQSSGSPIKTAPCRPSPPVVALSCSSNIAAVSWISSPGAILYSVVANSSKGYSAFCQSAGLSCNLTSLQCGQTYTVSVTAEDDLCSTASQSAQVKTVPCIPTDVMASYDCLSSAVAVSWLPSEGSDYYTALVTDGTGLSNGCQTAGTQCIIPDLQCGQNLIVTVVGEDTLCPSLQSIVTYTHSAPCVPVITAVVIDCINNTALVSWSASLGALSYSVTAHSNSGNPTCSSSDLSCTLANLTCGTDYTVQVVAGNNQCSSTASLAVLFQSDINLPMNQSDGQCDSPPSVSWDISSVPCPPQNIVTHLDCSADSANIQWDLALGAESYVVQAMDTDGRMTGCDTSGLNCTVQGLMCSSVYNITVVTINQYCNISNSTVKELNTVPCVPSGVQANVDCESGTMSVTWETSYGASFYTAMVQDNGGNESSCMTRGTLCVFVDLLCGHTYNAKVSAATDTCSSAYSSPITVETVPCEPQNVSAHINCHSNKGVVSWEMSNRVTSNLVVAVGPDGQSLMCNSTSTSCTLPTMHCGQQYNLTVTALGGVCNSSHSQVTVQSGPCAPGSLHINSQCIINSTSLTWDRGIGALQYLAVGTSASSHMVACNSSDTYCDLMGLQCGQVYNVSVYSMDTVCRSIQSVTSDLPTAPCPPQNVASLIGCDSGIMLVTWDPNMDVQFFLVDAVSEAGSSHSCNTTTSQCSISNLTCGESFSVRVIAVRGGCQSLPSEPVSVSSAPCMPTGVNWTQNCVANSAWVSWVPAQWVDNYTVTADGEGGYNSSCSTSGSTCEVPDLACGVRYTFYVTANTGHCESPPSMTFNIETAPCSLASIAVFTQCHSSSIQVQWEPSRSLLTNHVYIVSAVASDHSVLTCNSSATSCVLEGALCDLQYTVIVAASSDTCASLRSPPYKIDMEPCPPQDVVINPVCESHGVVVSWTPSPVAEAYVTTAVGGNGDVRSCNSSTNICSLPGLSCSQQYNISVSASNQNCSSVAGQTVTFNTAPCRPDDLSVSVQCANQSAMLSWRARVDVVGYWGSAQAGNGSRLYCESAGTSCTITGLECGTLYNFSVQATDGTCNSSFSEPLLAGAAPCPPEKFRVITLPTQNQTQYLRASWTVVACPNVQYLLEVTGRILGDSQSQFDLSSYWTNTSYFELQIPCGSSYSATVRSGNSAGESAPSVAVNGTTAPCPPQQVTYTSYNSSAIISWNASIYANDYTVYDTSSTVRTQVCSTIQLSCSLVNVSYSNLEVTARNSAGESDSTMVTSVQLSRRRRGLNEREISSVNGLAQPEVQVTVETPNTVLVDWAPVEGALYYTLVVQEQSTQHCHANRPRVLTVYDTNVMVAKLKPSTTYCLSVSAQTGTSEGPQSNPVCVQTMASVITM
ncbi:hypothetical protein DPEC_G00059970 [Dallia pectoralis]|uniref:Uncharacterized protein n=1 Tax=Dallia pectoralis TaxID=75939 RepID=A0ACC2H7U8_DALPE|nr:hypothetical protein DPEC_G00059970 [Dallia pectoralis]